MTLVLTTFIMLAFAGVYAGLLAMLGNRADALVAALSGTPRQADGGSAFGTATPAASRRFSRA